MSLTYTRKSTRICYTRICLEQLKKRPTTFPETTKTHTETQNGNVWTCEILSPLKNFGYVTGFVLQHNKSIFVDYLKYINKFAVCDYRKRTDDGSRS